MSTDFWNILFINMYIYEDGEDRTEGLCMQLSVIDYVISQNVNCQVCHIVIDGDVDFSRNWSHADLLTDFCDLSDHEL